MYDRGLLNTIAPFVLSDITGTVSASMALSTPTFVSVYICGLFDGRGRSGPLFRCELVGRVTYQAKVVALNTDSVCSMRRGFVKWRPSGNPATLRAEVECDISPSYNNTKQYQWYPKNTPRFEPQSSLNTPKRKIPQEYTFSACQNMKP